MTIWGNWRKREQDGTKKGRLRARSEADAAESETISARVFDFSLFVQRAEHVTDGVSKSKSI